MDLSIAKGNAVSIKNIILDHKGADWISEGHSRFYEAVKNHKRFSISLDANSYSPVNVPAFGTGGMGYVTYVPSEECDSEGLEIWRPLPECGQTMLA